MAQILIDQERCKGCGQCVQACPQGALAIGGRRNGHGYAAAEVVRPRHCLGCCLCGIACPDTAIRVRVQGTRYRYFAY
ncbi:MAG: 4Fe-4S binding protein [Candidatus Methylomirabilales bacterium]